MASLWQKTLYYLGLVDEEEGPEAEPGDGEVPAKAPPPQAPPRRTAKSVQHVGTPTGTIPGQRVEPPPRSRRRIAADPALAEAGVYISNESEESAVRPTSTTAESEVISANSFSDAQLLADLIRERTPVVLDLRTTEPEMVRRLVDFASGLTYALDGTMRRVAQGVILVTPPRVTVSRDERRRLASLGLYEGRDLS